MKTVNFRNTYYGVSKLMKQCEIAEISKLNQVTISNIVRGKSWKES